MINHSVRNDVHEVVLLNKGIKEVPLKAWQTDKWTDNPENNVQLVTDGAGYKMKDPKTLGAVVQTLAIPFGSTGSVIQTSLNIYRKCIHMKVTTLSLFFTGCTVGRPHYCDIIRSRCIQILYIYVCVCHQLIYT
jgi:hypothetical protein